MRRETRLVLGPLVGCALLLLGATPAWSQDEAGEAYGQLEVRSSPPGLEVILDGRPTGRTTPTVFDFVQVGMHAVELVGEGRRLAFETVLVSEGRLAQVDMEVRGFEGLVRVTATDGGAPVEAEIWVDGEMLGLTPTQLRFQPGPVELELRTERVRRIREIEVRPFRTTDVTIDLTAEGEPAARRETSPSPAPTRRPAPRSSRPSRPSRPPAPEPRPSRFDSEITGELGLLMNTDLAEVGTIFGASYALSLDSDWWLFGRLAVELSQGQDLFGAFGGVRAFLVDGRFSLYGGASLGLLPVVGETFGVGPQVGARLIIVSGLYAGVQVEAFFLPFAETETDLEFLLTGSAQVGFFFD